MGSYVIANIIIKKMQRKLHFFVLLVMQIDPSPYGIKQSN